MNLCGLWCIISIHISLLSHWAHLALMFQQHNPALFILCKTVSVDSHRCELFKTITTGRSFIAPLIGSGKFAILEWFHQRLQPQTHSLQTERCTMCFMCLNTGHRQKTTHTNSRSLSEISPPFSQVFSKRNHPPSFSLTNPVDFRILLLNPHYWHPKPKRIPSEGLQTTNGSCEELCVAGQKPPTAGSF